MIYLNEDEQKIVSQEIEKLEKSSSAELVTVISEKISNYKYESLVVNIIVVLIVSLLLIISKLTAFELLQLQIFVFFIIFISFWKYDTLVLDFLPKKYLDKRAKDYAKNQFNSLGKGTKHTMMFFVSLEEEYVEIIVDEKINTFINTDFIKEIEDEFTEDIKRDQISNGYLKAIQSCSDILIEKFPMEDISIHDLSSEVVELKY